MSDGFEILREALTVPEYARLVRKSNSGGYVDVAAGVVASVRIHGKILIPRAEVEALIARNTHPRRRSPR